MAPAQVAGDRHSQRCDGFGVHQFRENGDDSVGSAVGRRQRAGADRNPDPALHLDLVAHGARLVYDTVGRIKYRPDSVVLDLLETLASHGKLHQVCLGTDVGRSSMLISYGGGPGMDVLGREFVPRLRRQLGRRGPHGAGNGPADRPPARPDHLKPHAHRTITGS
ncbi:hypothetical protein ACFWRV_01610 [Streptomyces sp. NPDC058576]|uniref:hypothetical protein n=1 Tax=Streptomyces sp. NPDC058576 TaxID=3346547 RepID=UPI00364AEBDB